MENSFLNTIWIGGLFSVLTQTTLSFSAELPRISVLRFKDEGAHIVSGCNGWEEFRYQEQLQSQLEVALVKAGFKVQERKQINSLYESEHHLVNSSKKNRPKADQFKSAQFSIAGALTEFGLCTEGNHDGIQLGGILAFAGVPGSPDLKIKHSKVKSKVGLVAQIINVETAENEAAFEANAETEESGTGFSAGAMGIGASHTGTQKMIAEEASRQAIDQLVAQIKAHFMRQASN